MYRLRLTSIVLCVCFAAQSAAAPAAVLYTPPPHRAELGAAPPASATYPLPHGRTAIIGANGLGVVSDRSGAHSYAIAVMPNASRYDIQRELMRPPARAYDVTHVIAVLPYGTATRFPAFRTGLSQPVTFDDVRPMFASGAGLSTRASAPGRFGPTTFTMAQVYLVRVHGADAATAAKQLVRSGVAVFAEPDWRVDSMIAGTRPIPKNMMRTADWASANAQAQTAPANGVPQNFGLVSSFQSYLNANAVDVIPAYAELAKRFNQLPGEGEIITNVSIGDLTDDTMHDDYVQEFGYTTRLIGGQRYLDVPSMPLIPAYTADLSARLNPAGSVEGVDPSLSEVLLDFSVMAPLPHRLQRPSAQGQSFTDLLGIAPGAKYRLVVPQIPSFSNIETALLAAAMQQPRPNVITASLGFPEDGFGFPGRYLEDDPIAQAVISAIVNQYGIVVCISSNDGTRQYTPAAVGPDGGSAPTDVAPAAGVATNIADIGLSTNPSMVYDSGAIAVGGTTLDDIFTIAPQPDGSDANDPLFAETRTNGSNYFSSGFGSRVNVSAPSDNIASLVHDCCTYGEVEPTLESGTSASGPMTAAAAAIVLQAARLTGKSLRPTDVRDILVRTGRPVPSPPQMDRDIHVGPQIDIAAALDTVLLHAAAAPAIVRLSLAERQTFANLGQDFLDVANPQNIRLDGPFDLLGNGLGQNVVDPLTFAADVVNAPATGLTYRLLAGSRQGLVSQDRFPRVLPSAIFRAAGVPFVSSSPRTIPVTFQVLRNGGVIASSSENLVFSPTDGTYTQPTAPHVAPLITTGQDVRVQYDLSHVRNVQAPVLFVSSINHWSPGGAPLWRAAYQVALPASRGTVTIPASVFAAGEGVYGVGVLSNQDNETYGQFTSFRVGRTQAAARAPSPVFRVQGQPDAHTFSVDKASPQFTIAWDVTPVQATGAYLEISAPGPTIHNVLNTFTNQNGDRRDANGVDTASTAYLALPGPTGVLTLNARTLNLPASLVYVLRVVPTGGTRTLQASDDISLEYDDALPPNGELITAFSLDGPTSSVSTILFDSTNFPVYSALRQFDPVKEIYSDPLADDGTGQNLFVAFGHAPALHRTVGLEASIFGPQQFIQAFDDTTGARVDNIPIDAGSQLQLIDGTLDETRGRVGLIGYAPDGSGDAIAADLNAGTLGSPINVDAGARFPGIFSTIFFDQSTGKAFASYAFYSELCLIEGGAIKSVDFDTSTAGAIAKLPLCVSGFAPDNLGQRIYATKGPVLAYGDTLEPAHYFSVEQSTLLSTPPIAAKSDSPIYPAFDPIHGVLVIGFLAGSDYAINNNAMSEIRTYDAFSGQELSVNRSFNFINEAFGLIPFGVDRGIQLDPVHRTGYTFGPDAFQLQAFKY